MINLTPLLGRTASAGGQTVIDLRGPLRPVNSSNGRADVGAIVKACELAVSRGATSLTLNLSSKGGAAWEDAETLDLCKRLARSEAASRGGRKARPRAARLPVAPVEVIGTLGAEYR